MERDAQYFAPLIPSFDQEEDDTSKTNRDLPAPEHDAFCLGPGSEAKHSSSHETGPFRCLARGLQEASGECLAGSERHRAPDVKALLPGFRAGVPAVHDSV